MKAQELRQKFLDFFEKRGHKVIPSASLVPVNDPSVLFTTAGMQQFKRYYLFPDEAPASKIVTIQKCIRTGDIDEVGDESHLTFFEMLGNFSFGYPKKEGSYFKEDSIKMAWEFLTEDLGIEKERMSATYFKGEKEISRDEESYNFLKNITELPEDKIKGTGKDETFWSLGTEGSPGGPTVEFYVDGLEVWNLVFNEYVLKNGKFEPSEFKGVDTGMGFERLLAVLQKKSDVYETDLFEPIIKKIEEFSGKSCKGNKKAFRIIADHLRAAVFAIDDGVIPANKERGSVIRKLIRQAIAFSFFILEIKESFEPVIREVIAENKSQLNSSEIDIEVFKEEEYKYAKTIQSGLKIIKQSNTFNAKQLFDLEQSFGISLEISVEAIKFYHKEGVGQKIVDEVNDMRKKHQNLSRTASAGMFKGGLADNKEQTTKLHTAAHLLLASLKKVLSEDVEQKGANITEERLRFDFNWPEKLTPEQISEIENLVNSAIEQKLEVKMKEMSLQEAQKSGAHGTFLERYGDRVKVFTIGNPSIPFSQEICGGPHVKNTSELGHFKIIKEESSSAGIRRVKAVLE